MNDDLRFAEPQQAADENAMGRTVELERSNEQLRLEITERKRVEAALRASEERFRRLVDSVTDYLFSVQISEGTPVGTNHGPGCVSVTGFTPQEYENNPSLWYEMVHEDDRKAVLGQINDLLRGKTPPPLEHRIIHKSGWIRWVKNTSIPRFDAEGNLTAYDSLISDITECRATMGALRENEAKYRSFLENFEGIAYQIDLLTMQPLMVHGTVSEITGYTADDFLSGRIAWLDIVHPEDRRIIKEEISRLETGAGYVANYTYRIRRKDGAMRWARDICRKVMVASQEEPIYQGAVYDVTARIEAMNELIALEARFSKAFNGLPLLMTISTIDDGIYLEVNERFLEVSGFSRYEVIGKSSVEIGWMMSSERDDLLTVLRQHGRIREIPGTLTAKDGHKVDCIYSGEIISIENRDLLLLIGEDVTEQKSLAAQLCHSQKLETIGQLAGGIAHDFNNILTAIMGYANLILMKMPDSDIFKGHIEEIVKAGDRAANLTRSLLSFSRRETHDRRSADLNIIIEDIAKLLRRLIREDIDMQICVAGEKIPIFADVGQIEQVLINLVTNARDAMPNGGRIVIETGVRKADVSWRSDTMLSAEDPYGVITVTDTGTGIDEQVKEKIFEPFFTTKESGKGTGLGLSLVSGIVKQHHGFIRVESQIGQGTTFRIFLPLLIEIRHDSGRPHIVAAQRLFGQETVLLAEDDTMVRELLRRYLADHGYRVLEASDGLQAVNIFQERWEEIDLLLTDVIMPGMNGWQVYDEAVRINPLVKVIFMSGYTPELMEGKGLAKSGLPFIMKPVVPDKLCRHIREMLDNTL
ncbi:MAG: PAS domain S-box protein [Nitrospirae bacterium]|nr:PAS domain S-box protein [Nitrospirota bacterium]